LGYIRKLCIDLLGIKDEILKKNSLYKGTLQNIILKLLAKEVKMYGYQITQRAKELTQGELEMTEGALYPLLHKLEAEGMILSEIQKINGRDRKYYLLTEKGKKQQTEQEAEMKNYLFNLNTIFNI
jgi:PadR family transcriptional regulator, regulatory protein PadR